MTPLDEKVKKAHEALEEAIMCAIGDGLRRQGSDKGAAAIMLAHGAIDELANAVRSQHEDSGKSAVKILQRWIDDLQSGLYINCVYCGHRYGPGEGKPTPRAALEEHVSRCPHHPLGSALKQIAELKERLASAGVDARKVREAIEWLKKRGDENDVRWAMVLLEEALQPLCYIDHGDKPPMSIPHRHGRPEKVKR